MDKKENEVKSRYECMVSFDNKEYNVLLTITDTHMTFEKNSGLINKKFRVVKEIVIKDIKKLKDVVMIEYENERMTIHTVDEIVKFYCKKEDATRIMKEVKNILGLDFMKFIERTGEVLEEGLNEVADAAKGFVKEVSESEAVKEGVKVIKDAFTGAVDTLSHKK